MPKETSAVWSWLQTSAIYELSEIQTTYSRAFMYVIRSGNERKKERNLNAIIMQETHLKNSLSLNVKTSQMLPINGWDCVTRQQNISSSFFVLKVESDEISAPFLTLQVVVVVWHNEDGTVSRSQRSEVLGLMLSVLSSTAHPGTPSFTSSNFVVLRQWIMNTVHDIWR